ncbi:MAG: hypothetical protein ACLQAT_19285 [Candidatus Binataceae bacterium]
MAATGSAYLSVFLATIAPLHEVARPLLQMTDRQKLTEAEENQNIFLQNKPNLSLILLNFLGLPKI